MAVLVASKSGYSGERGPGISRWTVPIDRSLVVSSLSNSQRATNAKSDCARAKNGDKHQRIQLTSDRLRAIVTLGSSGVDVGNNAGF